MREPSVYMWKVLLYCVCISVLKIVLPRAGQAPLDHCVGRETVTREERGNQGPTGEVFSRVRKEGGITRRVAKKERALSTKGVWA